MPLDREPDPVGAGERPGGGREAVPALREDDARAPMPAPNAGGQPARSNSGAGWRFPLPWPEAARDRRRYWSVAAGALGLVLLLAALIGPGHWTSIGLDARIAASAGNLTDSAGYAEVLSDLSALGSEVVVAAVAGLVALLLLVARRWLSLLFLLATVGAGFVFAYLIKFVVDRSRPPTPFGLAETSPSFPSGHAVGSTLLCLALLALLLPWEPRTRWPLLTGVALAVPLVVGATRILLAVHYLSDVLAGWAFGCGWFALMIAVLRPWRDIDRIRASRGMEELPPPGPGG